MGGARSKRHGNRSEGPISLRAEILVTHDPRVRERQVNAIRNFLLALSARLGDSATSDTRVGDGYWWVECAGCESGWQVPFYAQERVG
jgi:hypothetical protein